MSEHFFDNEFEPFLQQQVKQHRMYPSDAVWKGIYQQLHSDKKWPGLYFIAILIVAALSVCTIFMDASPVVTVQQRSVPQIAATYQLDPVAVTNETVEEIRESHHSNTYTADNTVAPASTFNYDAAITPDVAELLRQSTVTITTIPDVRLSPELDPSVVAAAYAAGNTADRTRQLTVKPMMLKKLSTTATPSLSDVVAATPVQVKSRINRWQYQVYMTPATNFKRTVDNKPTSDAFNGPVVNTSGITANQVIRYAPGMGIEFGLGALYSVNRNLRIKAGLQYNVRQYNIEAYDGGYEVSSIAMVNGGSVSQVPTLSKYRSYGANYNEALLLNKYHQVSMPVGVEYAIINRDRVALNLGATLQPTYTFSESAYLLTADYKSYADGTSMIRRWNLNSSFEANIAVNVGDFQWKFGPQLRYQHLSTFSNKYPIKEYLIDYGFKIGFTKTIK